MSKNTETPYTASIPFIVHESDMARIERHSKRQWIVILALIAALVGSNVAWVVYESQFTTVCEQYDVNQESNGTSDNNSIINGGHIGNGSETDN